MSWRTFAGFGCGSTRSLTPLPREFSGGRLRRLRQSDREAFQAYRATPCPEGDAHLRALISTSFATVFMFLEVPDRAAGIRSFDAPIPFG